MNSSFSEAAAAGHGPPLLHRLGGGQQQRPLSVTQNETTWHVRVVGGAYNLHREAWIDGSRVLVKYTIETHSQDWHHLASTDAVGLQVNHSVHLTTGSSVAASVPGELYALSCSNANAGRDEDGKAKYSLNRGGFGYTSGGGGRRGGDAGGVWGVNFGPKAAVDLWRQERQKAPSTDGIPPGH